MSIIALITRASSFSVPSSQYACKGRQGTTYSSLFLERQSSSDESSKADVQQRRDFLATTVTASILPFSLINPALADEETTGMSLGPICVIGANGKTGSECVGACLSRGIDVVATSRGGVYSGSYESMGPNVAVCDVTIPSTIQSAVKGSRAVIFAASASKAGGTAAAVDNIGLVNVAKACIENKIPHLVIVSSGAVTKPDSPVYKFLNLFGNIMEEKIRGEDSVRDLYKSIDISTSTYTVIRPGGLTEEDGQGVKALELNQGDSKSGRIARADVAALCIEATNFPKLSGGTTFECYNADTGKPLQSVGLSNILKQRNKSNDDVFLSGKERRGATYEGIFTGLEKDA